MRIEFASGTRDAVNWLDGSLRLGSAPGCEVRLVGAGVAAQHARLSVDRRGLVLDVERGAGRVYVNARPVRERALLRLGDVLGIGSERLRLVADAAVADAPSAAEALGKACVVALRAVAGPLSGRVWPLTNRLWLDASGPVTAASTTGLSLRLDDGQVWLDTDTQDAGMMVCINGVAAARGRLRDGDQLAAGVHRFVLDAAACQPLAVATSAVAAAPSDVASVHRPGREMGWLIATAVVVALLLIWALLTHG